MFELSSRSLSVPRKSLAVAALTAAAGLVLSGCAASAATSGSGTSSVIQVEADGRLKPGGNHRDPRTTSHLPGDDPG